MELYFELFWPSVPYDDSDLLASQDIGFDDVRDYPRPVPLTKLDAVEIDAARAEAAGLWVAAKDGMPFGARPIGYAVCDVSGACIITHYEPGASVPAVDEEEKVIVGRTDVNLPSLLTKDVRGV